MAINLVDSGSTISLEFTVDYNAGRGVISATKVFINKDDFEVSSEGSYVIIRDKDKDDQWKILYSDITTPSGASASAVAVLIEAFQDTASSTVSLGAGSALIGKVGIDQVTANANEVVVKSITAGETHIGEVGGKTTLVQSTVVMSVAGAYATGDYMGTTTTPQSFASAVRVSGGTGIIKSVLISDKITNANVAMELWIIDRTYTAPTDNAAWNFSDTDMLFVQAVIPITTAGWYASSAGQVYFDGTISIPIKSNGTTLFYALVARGTPPAFTSSDLTITLGILQD